MFLWPRKELLKKHRSNLHAAHRMLLRPCPYIISIWILKLRFSLNILLGVCVCQQSRGCVFVISHVQLWGCLVISYQSSVTVQSALPWQEIPPQTFNPLLEVWPCVWRLRISHLHFFFSHWGKWCEMEIPDYLRTETSSFKNYKWILLRTSHQDLLNSTWRQTKQQHQQLSSHSDTEMVSVKGVATVITLITMCVLATHTSTGIFFPVLI